jgi:hypothetical protein
MKARVTIILLAFALGAFAGNPETKEAEKNLKTVQQLELREIPALVPEWDTDRYFRGVLIQPTEVNEAATGTMPLSAELPFVHTLRGTVYTFEHIRYTVR